jgi:hypothetical protein
MSQLGHGLKYSPRAQHVRSTFGSGRSGDNAALTLRAQGTKSLRDSGGCGLGLSAERARRRV